MDSPEIQFGVPHHPFNPDGPQQLPMRRYFTVEAVGFGRVEISDDVGVQPGFLATFYKVHEESGSSTMTRGWVDPEHAAFTVITEDELLATAIRKRFGGFFES